MKTLYIATFSGNRVAKRNSDNEYRFAWLISSTTGCENTGFSSTKENAVKAANHAASVRHYKPTYGVWTIEIVEAVKA